MSAIEKLCKRVRKMGYEDPNQQLVNEDGSCIGDLLYFFEDNPGCIDAIHEWIDAYYDDESTEEELDDNADDELEGVE